MKIKVEVELDTDSLEDKEVIEQLMTYLQMLQDTYYDDEGE
jgi:hypothetical protein